MKTPEFFDLDQVPDSALLTAEQVAGILGVSPDTLNIWRCVGRYNLPFVKAGRNVRYKAGALKSFIGRRTVGEAAV